MKIEFDKYFIWLLPYLYFVSMCYYWGYWGAFDVDAVNYYATSDLVKGIASPISSTLFFLGAYIFIMKAIELIIGRINIPRLRLWFLLVVAVLLTVTIGLLFADFITKSKNVNYASPTPIADNTSLVLEYQLLPSLVTITLAFIIHFMYTDRKELLPKWWLIFLLLFPSRAFSDGATKAVTIFRGTKFDYVVADSLASAKKDTYKFLGKAGEYYILETLSNTKSIIIPASKLAPLVIEKFSIYDTASIRRFKRNRKLVTAPAPSPKPLEHK
jgi:hypothetical protein